MNTLSFQNMLVGDVQIASSQSNMEFGIQSDIWGREAIQQTHYQRSRFFHVPVATTLKPPTAVKGTPHEPLSGKWIVCTLRTLGMK